MEAGRAGHRGEGDQQAGRLVAECQEEMSPVNTDELDGALFHARRRVLKIQTKLHRWASDDRHRRFDDLFNLVADPGFLLVAWDQVRGNKGARTAGVDGRTAVVIEAGQGVGVFLDDLRSTLKDRSFCPMPVAERMIPKTGGKLRRLGVPTVTDRVVQASLKLVLEPIFEADFLPCSYGFRPNRRAHDAVAEIRYLATRPRCYEWVVEGDIRACFDEIDHAALMGRVRSRIGDKRVLGLVKAFLKAGVLTEGRQIEDTTAGTPQGGILSPLLSNVALSVVDEFIASEPGGPSTGKLERARRLREHRPNFRLVRYADDWCLMVRGSRADAVALRDQIAEVLTQMGLRLSEEKTFLTHIDAGLDFLGWRIQRHRKRGTSRYYVYVYPSKASLQAAKRKIKTLCQQVEVNQSVDDLLRRINPALQGWCAYFRPGVSSVTFSYLSHYAWQTVWRWLRRKHRQATISQLRQQYCGGGWWPASQDRELFDPEKVSTTRYRYRGAVIPSPWPILDEDPKAA